VDVHPQLRIAVLAPEVREDPARRIGRPGVGDVREELALAGSEVGGYGVQV
jgi:hypothetical protein